ncbi:hypothetical protein, partial [Shewanella algae]|uniref:hypothetical protein n=1 Tax=Shewanella algae TaxID=38313 RepID=UPI00313FAE96
YIRALAADLAIAAGTCAHQTALRRTSSSALRVEDAIPLEEALARDQLPLRPLEEALAHLPKVICDAAVAQKIRQGNLAA